jgi:hypothetical protein
MPTSLNPLGAAIPLGLATQITTHRPRGRPCFKRSAEASNQGSPDLGERLKKRQHVDTPSTLQDEQDGYATPTALNSESAAREGLQPSASIAPFIKDNSPPTTATPSSHFVPFMERFDSSGYRTWAVSNPPDICQDSFEPAHLPPISQETAGITRTKQYLRQSRLDTTKSSQYESSVIAHGSIWEFFTELVRIHVISPNKQEASADRIRYQKHDYNHNHTRVATHVHIRWIDLPGLNPGDIRARSFRLDVTTPSMARKPDMVVWRSTYFCNGSCSLTPPDRQAHEATVEEELKNRAEIIRHQLESDELPESPPSRSTGPKNRRTCPYAAQLVLEMTERQAVNGTCTVRWMKSECHPRPQDLSVLRMAPFIRSWLHEAALLFAMTPKRLEIR